MDNTKDLLKKNCDDIYKITSNTQKFAKSIIIYSIIFGIEVLIFIVLLCIECVNTFYR